MSVAGFKLSAMNVLRECRQAQQEVNIYKPVVASSNRRWSVPPQGCVKINVDATLFTDAYYVSIGGIIRDGDGRFL